jgi:hypothetical protein
LAVAFKEYKAVFSKNFPNTHRYTYMKVPKIPSETKRSSANSGLMWWTAANVLDAEMRRRLKLKDKPSSKESCDDGSK